MMNIKTSKMIAIMFSGIMSLATVSFAHAADVMTNAEVRRVDKTGNRITLKHDEIKNLDMPPMTMVFRVKDPAMLDQVKAGDKVRFSAEDLQGVITVTRIESNK